MIIAVMRPASTAACAVDKARAVLVTGRRGLAPVRLGRDGGQARAGVRGEKWRVGGRCWHGCFWSKEGGLACYVNRRGNGVGIARDRLAQRELGVVLYMGNVGRDDGIWGYGLRCLFTPREVIGDPAVVSDAVAFSDMVT